VKWIHLARDVSLPGKCENENLLNVRFPLGTEYFLAIGQNVSFSKEAVLHTAIYIYLTGLIRREKRETSGIYVCMMAFG